MTTKREPDLPLRRGVGLSLLILSLFVGQGNFTAAVVLFLLGGWWAVS